MSPPCKRGFQVRTIPSERSDVPLVALLTAAPARAGGGRSASQAGGPTIRRPYDMAPKKVIPFTKPARKIGKPQEAAQPQGEASTPGSSDDMSDAVPAQVLLG